MSKGLGHIERAIERIIHNTLTSPFGAQCVSLSSWEIAGNVYKESWELSLTLTAAQKIATVRAMHSFIKKFPQYALMGGQGRKRLYLYDPAARDSVTWTKAKVTGDALINYEAAIAQA